MDQIGDPVFCFRTVLFQFFVHVFLSVLILTSEKDQSQVILAVHFLNTCSILYTVFEQMIRGRLCDETKPETFNQLWTVEEQVMGNSCTLVAAITYVIIMTNIVIIFTVIRSESHMYVDTCPLTTCISTKKNVCFFCCLCLI